MELTVHSAAMVYLKLESNATVVLKMASLALQPMATHAITAPHPAHQLPLRDEHEVRVKFNHQSNATVVLKMASLALKPMATHAITAPHPAHQLPLRDQHAVTVQFNHQ